MKASKINTSQRWRTSAINLLLVGLLVFSGSSLNEKIQARQTAEQSGPTSIGPATTLLRNHALTVSPSQRVAGEFSKQGRTSHSSMHAGLAANEFAAAPKIIRQRLVMTDQSVWYLSFRTSRPRGRAPPVSA
jgi:hypothetical protein